MLTFDEFRNLPLEYTMGMTGDAGAQRMYRNNEHGVQKEVHTKRKKKGDIYSGWKEGRVYFYLDGVDKEFRTIEDLYNGYVEKMNGRASAPSTSE